MRNMAADVGRPRNDLGGSAALFGGKMKPALTAEEWGRKNGPEYVEEDGRRYFSAMQHGDGSVGVSCGDERGETTERPHALAALALHGQPFGFTWEDVDHLRLTADVLLDHDKWNEPEAARLFDLADRIEALLPPREGPENP